jgi:general secretion pathway protein A
MEHAGMPSQQIFPEALLAEIHLRAQGIPRIINAVCDNLLLTAFALETRVCTLGMLDEICKDMRLEWPNSRRARLRMNEEYESTGFKL